MVLFYLSACGCVYDSNSTVSIYAVYRRSNDSLNLSLLAIFEESIENNNNNKVKH